MEAFGRQPRQGRRQAPAADQGDAPLPLQGRFQEVDKGVLGLFLGEEVRQLRARRLARLQHANLAPRRHRRLPCGFIEVETLRWLRRRLVGFRRAEGEARAERLRHLRRALRHHVLHLRIEDHRRLGEQFGGSDEVGTEGGQGVLQTGAPLRLGVLRQHQLGCLEQRDGFHLVGAALRRRIVGAEGGDPPLLVVDPDSGIAAGRRREDVDHGAAHRHLAGLVRAVVEDVAQALQPGAQRVRVERIAGPQRDAGVRRTGEALGRRFDGQDEEAGARRLRRQPRNHRHARAHGRAGGRDAVVGQAIPGGQQQRFHLRPPERGGGGVQPGGAGFAAGDEDQPGAFRRRGLFEKTGGEEGFGFGLHGRATTLLGSERCTAGKGRRCFPAGRVRCPLVKPA